MEKFHTVQENLKLAILFFMLFIFSVMVKYFNSEPVFAANGYNDCSIQYWIPQYVPVNGAGFWIDVVWNSPQFTGTQTTSNGVFYPWGVAGSCPNYVVNPPVSWNCEPLVDRNGVSLYTASVCEFNPPAPDIKANNSNGPVSISSNQSVNLSWTSSYADSCSALATPANSNWSRAKSLNGSQNSGNLTASTEFALECINAFASASDSVAVTIVSPTPSCTPRNLESSSVSPTSVNAGGNYDIVCDYNTTVSSVFPQQGSGTCTFTDNNGTKMNFDCTAGSTAGTFNNNCYLTNIAPDNYCSGADPISQLTVTVPNSTPNPTNVTVTEPNYCSSGPAANVSWTYSDPNNNPQSAFQIQIDDQPSFNNPELDTGKVLSSSTSVFTGQGILLYNTTYSARVRVWDSTDAVSDWVTMSICNGPGCI